MATEFDEVDLHNPPQGQWITILLAQIAASEGDFHEEDGLLIANYSDAMKDQFAELEKLVAKHNVNLVALPELVSSADMRSAAKQLTLEHPDLLIISGTSYFTNAGKRVSRVIVLHSGNEYYSDKIDPSPYEKNAYEPDTLSTGEKIIRFSNSPAGNIVILICSDFLNESLRSTALQNETDILVVPACQSNSEIYYNQFGHVCRQNTSGIYGLYSNLSFLPYGDGSSAIFGNLNQMFMRGFPERGISDLVPLEKVWQADSHVDWVVAKLNLAQKKIELPNSTFTDPNIQIIEFKRSRGSIRNGLSRRKYRLVAFDVHGPLIRGLLRNHSWLAIWGYLGDDTMWRELLSTHRSGKISYTEWCRTAVHIFGERGVSQDVIRSLCLNASLVENFETGISKLRQEGFIIGMISGGVDMYLKEHVPDYDRYFDFCYVNKFLFDGSGKLSDVQVDGRDYAEKSTALMHECSTRGIKMSETVYVGDQLNDDGALSSAGHSIVCTSDDSTLLLRHDKVIAENDLEAIADYIISLN
ncbi:MAG: HAD hydrolase family protein [Pseudomonadota bacterium]